ncbi:MAG: sulfotransferase [Deltaproteobacteria bacterium]|nr:sulfotransferase [Deltaproteobacteria bacterium]
MNNGMAQPVIMLGCQRSGTTYLAKVLGLHEKGFFWSEATVFRYMVLFFWNYIRDRGSFRQPRFMEVLHMLKAPRGMPINEQGEKILASFERTLLGYFNDGRLEAWADKGRKREFLQALSYDTMTLGASEVAYWGDKYPEYVFQIPELVDMFPEARFVFVIRNPYAVAESLVRHLNPRDRVAGGMRFTLKDCWDQWFDWNRVWIENHELIPAANRFVIRYEEFLLDTGRVMGDLSAFMDVDLMASPGIRNELKAIQPHNLDKWKKTDVYEQLRHMPVAPDQVKVFDYYGGL